MPSNDTINLDQAAAPGLLRRLMAILYDSLLVFGLLLLGSILVTVPVGILIDQATAEALPQQPLFRLWLACIPPIFFLYFWVRGGQTLGMRSWRLRVIRDDGQPLRTRDALLRMVSALLSWLPLGLGFLWSLFDPQGQTWHDRLSKTRLVMLQKKEKKG